MVLRLGCLLSDAAQQSGALFQRQLQLLLVHKKRRKHRQHPDSDDGQRQLVSNKVAGNGQIQLMTGGLGRFVWAELNPAFDLTPFTGQRSAPCTHARSLDVTEARTTHLEVVVFVRVGHQEIFGALDVIGQLGLRQLRPKLLQQLGCGFHRHGKVLYGLREKILVSPPAAKLKLKQAGSDPPSGGGSTGCGSTPGSLPVPRSAGLCPRTRGGPTESSASLSATQVPAVTLCLAQPAFPTWLIMETSEAVSQGRKAAVPAACLHAVNYPVSQRRTAHVCFQK